MEEKRNSNKENRKMAWIGGFSSSANHPFFPRKGEGEECDGDQADYGFRNRDRRGGDLERHQTEADGLKRQSRQTPIPGSEEYQESHPGQQT